VGLESCVTAAIRRVPEHALQHSRYLNINIIIYINIINILY